jgi:hypothetical protein
MKTDLATTFEEEFLSYFALCLMNLVFGTITLSFGVQFIVSSVLGQPGVQDAPELRAVTGAVAMMCFGLGLFWILVTARLFKSVKVVRNAYKQKKRREMSPEDFTGMLVRMMTQYREEKGRIRAMVFVCMFGGLCFVVLGVLTIGQIPALVAAGSATLTVLLAVAAAVICMIVGGASFLVSTYFRRYARVWDARLDALAVSENELGRMLERALPWQSGAANTRSTGRS